MALLRSFPLLKYSPVPGKKGRRGKIPLTEAYVITFLVQLDLMNDEKQQRIHGQQQRSSKHITDVSSITILGALMSGMCTSNNEE